jgi:RP/EB family microtubule-associated protein
MCLLLLEFKRSNMANADSIGMMDPAYFVSRTELLSWVNSFFSLSLTKVEQAASGALYCQIVDACYPGTVQMHKVNWSAKHEHEFVANYKVLQQALAKKSVQKYVDVPKLIRAKYQDNLEFLQWLKRFFDMNYNHQPYDAEERRRGASMPTAAPSARRVTTEARVLEPAQVRTKVVAPSTKEVESLRLKTDTLEKERDFYFSKLRNIEVYAENYPDKDSEVIQSIQEILFATGEVEVQVDAQGVRVLALEPL